MPKLLPLALITTSLLFVPAAPPKPATAGTCVAGSSCGPQPMQFVPGERITVEVVNFTESVVEVQQPSGTDPLAVNPGQMLSFVRGGGTNPNFSIVMWDVLGLPLKFNLQKPEATVLRIEVRPGGRPPGDRAVYLQDDGRILVM